MPAFLYILSLIRYLPLPSTIQVDNLERQLKSSPLTLTLQAVVL